jgi:hypothetical protein
VDTKKPRRERLVLGKEIMRMRQIQQHFAAADTVDFRSLFAVVVGNSPYIAAPTDQSVP